ncbi:hypothetical protein LCGC14_0506330 [marine sediment metagenome]|uniref:Uncharacterized protein n=1 Tax=marine sediment metagenome TaxID=412755 RepID=A0A0F9VAZ8_9ZZZZ
MVKVADKIKVCLYVGSELYKNFNHAILEKYGNVHGHIGKTLEEAIKLWLKYQENGEN